MQFVSKSTGLDSTLAEHALPDAAGEHLLSGVLEKQLGVATTSWRLQPLSSSASAYVSVDVLASILTPQQLTEAEQQSNAHIRAGLSVKQLLVLDGPEGQIQKEAMANRFSGCWPTAAAMHVSHFLRL